MPMPINHRVDERWRIHVISVNSGSRISYCNFIVKACDFCTADAAVPRLPKYLRPSPHLMLVFSHLHGEGCLGEKVCDCSGCVRTIHCRPDCHLQAFAKKAPRSMHMVYCRSSCSLATPALVSVLDRVTSYFNKSAYFQSASLVSYSPSNGSTPSTHHFDVDCGIFGWRLQPGHPCSQRQDQRGRNPQEKPDCKQRTGSSPKPSESFRSGRCLPFNLSSSYDG